MTNPNKLRGDRAEREALAWWLANHPDLMIRMPKRELGAGRKLDEGDLRVLDHCAVQVKTGKLDYLPAHLRAAAAGARRQAVNRDVRFGVGMCKVLGARTDPRWLFSCGRYDWPSVTAPALITAFPKDAIALCRSSALPMTDRIALVRSNRAADLVIATPEAWVAAYRAAVAAGDTAVA